MMKEIEGAPITSGQELHDIIDQAVLRAIAGEMDLIDICRILLTQMQSLYLRDKANGEGNDDGRDEI